MDAPRIGCLIYKNTIEEPISASFEPQADITAFELAQMLPYFSGKPMFPRDWKALGGMQRHFKKREPAIVAPQTEGVKS